MLEKKKQISLQTLTLPKCRLPLNGMQFNIPSTEWHALSGRMQAAQLGNANARSHASWAILSISGNYETTSHHQTFLCMIGDCSTHSSLSHLNFIVIPSFVCSKLICIELLISLHNDWHLFADGFVPLRPIAMKFGWDKENVSSLKFRKFHLNPSNFTRKLTTMFKLDFKKYAYPKHTLDKERVTGKSQYFAQEMTTCMLFMHQPKIVQIGWGHHFNFSVWKKIGHYFWRIVYTVWLFFIIVEIVVIVRVYSVVKNNLRYIRNKKLDKFTNGNL